MKLLMFLSAASVGALLLQDAGQNITPMRVGPLQDGGFLLNSGWTIRPAGQQIPVDTFPMSTAVSTECVASSSFVAQVNGNKLDWR